METIEKLYLMFAFLIDASPMWFFVRFNSVSVNSSASVQLFCHQFLQNQSKILKNLKRFIVKVS
jgi:hypothetical protein